MQSKQIYATYLGGPTIIIEIGGLTFMTDPTLDPEGTFFKLNETMTERKLAGPALYPEKSVDIVLLSHDQHFDNLDGLGRSFLKEVGEVLTTKAGAERLKANSIGLDPHQQRTFTAPSGEKIKVTATPARHGPAGIEKITGDVIGFHIVKLIRLMVFSCILPAIRFTTMKSSHFPSVLDRTTYLFLRGLHDHGVHSM
ncbi:MBL fold metallo-hydrolase [Sphingobacterium thalpophilum]|uniref:MBL fold metallo-hydrolase n=1 Tax=Sphingobacterium thalpophilum TaxID=259 RepID=UPI0037D9B30A